MNEVISLQHGLIAVGLHIMHSGEYHIEIHRLG